MLVLQDHTATEVRRCRLLNGAEIIRKLSWKIVVDLLNNPEDWNPVVVRDGILNCSFHVYIKVKYLLISHFQINISAEQLLTFTNPTSFSTI